MHRFYIEKIDGNSITLIESEQLHHIRDVLRLKAGDAVIIFDRAGHEYKAVIVSIGKKQVELNLTSLNVRRSNNTNLTVACAIPKGSRMDDIIDYLTQLGVEHIIPMLTDRVVVKPDSAAMQIRLLRWRKIAQNAAQQCQRSSVPVIAPVTDVKDVITNSQDFDLKLIPHLSGKRKLIKNILAKPRPKNIIVLIGPEGDFTPEEVALALHNDFIPVSLGDTVLRVATAAIAIASYIKFALDR
jgi:16S rRNA (uracil1498-N3)-methyltransferase